VPGGLGKHAEALLRTVLVVLLASGFLPGCKTSSSSLSIAQIRARMADTNPTASMPSEPVGAGAIANLPGSTYDQRLVWGIQTHWAAVLAKSGLASTQPEKVVVTFRLQDDGTITELKVIEGEEYHVASLCARRTIKQLAPFPSWPDEMKQLVKSRYRDVRFTFSYTPSPKRHLQPAPPSPVPLRQF
jgi:hypothetical protein